MTRRQLLKSGIFIPTLTMELVHGCGGGIGLPATPTIPPIYTFGQGSVGIAVLQNGQVYTTKATVSGQYYLVRYDDLGKATSPVTLTALRDIDSSRSYASYLAVSPSTDRIYVSEGTATWVYDLSGQYLFQLERPNPDPHAIPFDTSLRITGLQEDAQGNVYVQDEYHSDIIKYDAQGNVLQLIQFSANGKILRTGTPIAMDAQGFFFAANLRSPINISVFASDGTWQRDLPIVDRYGNIDTIALDGRGNIYIAQAHEPHFEAWSQQGRKLASVSLHVPVGNLATDAANNVYETGEGGVTVYKPSF